MTFPLVLRWSAPSQGTGSFAAVIGNPGPNPWDALGQTYAEWQADIVAQVGDQLPTIAALLMPSGATAVMSDPNNAILIGDLM